MVAEKSMSYSAARRRRTKQSADVGVFVDGTWQRKSLSSTLGVVTAIFIDNRKVLDVAILSKSCKGYTSMKKWPLLIPLVMRYGSYLIIVILIIPASPGMETARSTKIFSSSKEKHGLYYTSFYGDGDCKVYLAVKDKWCKQTH